MCAACRRTRCAPSCGFVVVGGEAPWHLCVVSGCLAAAAEVFGSGGNNKWCSQVKVRGNHFLERIASTASRARESCFDERGCDGVIIHCATVLLGINGGDAMSRFEKGGTDARKLSGGCSGGCSSTITRPPRRDTYRDSFNQV